MPVTRDDLLRCPVRRAAPSAVRLPVAAKTPLPSEAMPPVRPDPFALPAGRPLADRRRGGRVDGDDTAVVGAAVADVAAVRRRRRCRSPATARCAGCGWSASKLTRSCTLTGQPDLTVPSSMLIALAMCPVDARALADDAGHVERPGLAASITPVPGFRAGWSVAKPDTRCCRSRRAPMFARPDRRPVSRCGAKTSFARRRRRRTCRAARPSRNSGDATTIAGEGRRGVEGRRRASSSPRPPWSASAGRSARRATGSCCAPVTDWLVGGVRAARAAVPVVPPRPRRAARAAGPAAPAAPAGAAGAAASARRAAPPPSPP